MNKVYITCKIEKISKLGFDYYNHLKPYYILVCNEVFSNESNIFKVVIYDKLCNEYKLKENMYVYIVGNIISIKNDYYIFAEQIYYFD